MVFHDGFVHFLAVLSAVWEDFVRVCPGEAQTLPDAGLDLDQRFPAQGTLPENAAKRDGKTCMPLPPLAEIEQLFKLVARIGETAFVDDEAGNRFSPGNGIHDAVEGHDQNGRERGVEEPKE